MGWTGGDEEACILRLYQQSARGLIKAPAGLQPLVEKLAVAEGKSIGLDPEDKEALPCGIELLAGLVKAAVNFLEQEGTKLVK
jgi:hypothetical protein